MFTYGNDNQKLIDKEQERKRLESKKDLKPFEFNYLPTYHAEEISKSEFLFIMKKQKQRLTKEAKK